MGHIESFGAAPEQDAIEPVEPVVRPPGLMDTGVWPTWRGLTRLFSSWSFLISGFTTPGAWSSVGNDFLSGFRRNWSTRKAFALTESLTDAELSVLTDMAGLNLRRHEAILRVVVVSYATVPLTVLALVAEVSSASLIGLLREHFMAVAQLMGALLLGVLIYVVGTWRARQMVSVLELVRIERGWKAQQPCTSQST